MSCHNVDTGMKNYQLRCALAIITSLDDAARQGSAESLTLLLVRDDIVLY